MSLLLRHMHPVLSVPGSIIVMPFSTEHRTRLRQNYRRCRTVSLVLCCNSGSFVTQNFYWSHYTGFQYLSGSTSNWQLWFSRYSLLLNLNTFISWSPVNTLVHRWPCAHQLVLYSKYHAPRTRTAYGSRAFSSAVPSIWNNVPTSVTEANSLPVFRRRLKTHLFSVAFENSG